MSVELGEPGPVDALFRARADQLAALTRLSETATRAAGVDEVYAAALDCLAETLSSSRASVLLFDDDGVMRFKAWRGLSDGYRSATEGHTPWPRDTKDPVPVLVADVAGVPELAELRPTIEGEGIRSLGFFPLVTGGRLLGKFMVYFDTPHSFTDGEVRLASAIGSHIALEIGRRQAEDEVQRNAALLAAQSELASEGILVVATDGRIVSYNRAYAEMWGVPRELLDSRSDEVVLEAVRRLVADPDPFLERVDHLYAHPEERSSDEIALVDGRVLERQGAPVENPDGTLYGRVWLFHDVTEQHRARNAARHLQAVTESLARALTLGEIADALVREGAAALGATAGWLAAVDRERSELRRLASIGYQDDLGATYESIPLDAHSATVAAAIEGRSSWFEGRDELVAAYPEIAHHYDAAGFEAMAVVPLAVAGRTAGVIALNFAERRTFDDDDRALLAALAGQCGHAIERANLYAQLQERADAASVLAHVGDGVFQLDQDDRVTLWNRGAEVLTGIAERDALGAGIAELFGGWEEIRPRISVTDVPLAFGRREALPVQIGGRELWLAISGVESRDGVVYAFRDVTDSEQLEKARRDFLSTASHELRTPLAGVFGATKTLLHRDVDEAMRRELLELIDGESERLARILDELLFASRLDEGKVELSIGSCDLAELARDAIELQRAHAPGTIALALEAPEGLPRACCDPVRLRQVVVNLLDNAVKYSPDGGTIIVSLAQRDRVLELAVADEGLGIPPAERERIFEKFYRLDPELSRGVGGTGLGLYICREFVSRMDGRIWVDANGERGSVFRVELPVAP